MKLAYGCETPCVTLLCTFLPQAEANALYPVHKVPISMGLKLIERKSFKLISSMIKLQSRE